MASIRRKKHEWQAVIRRVGQPTISKSFISKTDARKWALACAVSKKHPAALKLNAEISKDALRRAEIQADVEARRRAYEERLRQNEERSRLEWEALPSEKKAEEVGRKIGQGLGRTVDSIIESEAGKSIKGFWKGLTE
jgi:hypothetical protein